MTKYRVALNGQNFLLKSEGKVSRYGFYTTRFVEAASPDDAELSAVALIRNDPELRAAVLNERNNPPRIDLEELAELESFDGVAVPGSGYTFYVEESQ